MYTYTLLCLEREITGGIDGFIDPVLRTVDPDDDDDEDYLHIARPAR